MHHNRMDSRNASVRTCVRTSHSNFEQRMVDSHSLPIVGNRVSVYRPPRARGEVATGAGAVVALTSFENPLQVVLPLLYALAAE